MEPVDSKNFPAPKGPFSYAVISNGFVFVSGQAATDLETGEFKLGDIRHETELTLLNIKRVLEAAGTNLDHVVKCSVYLKEINDFAAMNDVYQSFFKKAQCPPARTTVQAVMGSGIKIEIDAIAELPQEERAGKMNGGE